MSENIYYVHPNGSPTGEVEEKYAAHTDDTKLHAGFSVYVFNEAGKFLVTQRAHSKKVWPDVWTNSCCGHPLPDESRENAIARRLQYELGMTAKDVTVVLPNYTYKTPPYKGIIEHEYCPVYFARATSDPVPNPDEVADFKWVSWQEYVSALEADDEANVWSWWCKDQLKQLSRKPEIETFTLPTTE